jgi:hypothetical protein
MFTRKSKTTKRTKSLYWRGFFGGYLGGEVGNFVLLETLKSDVEDTSNVEGIAWWAYCSLEDHLPKTKGEEEEVPVC